MKAFKRKKLVYSVAILSLILITACTQRQAKKARVAAPPFDPHANQFTVTLRLNGVIPYGDSRKHVLQMFGQADSVVEIKTIGVFNHYFKGVGFRAVGDSLWLRLITFKGHPTTFVIADGMRIDGKTTAADVKKFHPHQNDAEIDAGDRKNYRVLWLPATVSAGFIYWILYFDIKTGYLSQMKFVMID